MIRRDHLAPAQLGRQGVRDRLVIPAHVPRAGGLDVFDEHEAAGLTNTRRRVFSARL
jgi:hypothetical protein